MGPIGIFDSGYGGLTVLQDIRERLPQYDFLYLGDNARAPYGSRSFDVVYEYTLQAVNELFSRGCELVILACNTASAKALRNIQQNDLPTIDPEKRVLGVIRPSAEIVGQFTTTNSIGILATQGTVNSNSFVLEIAKFSLLIYYNRI
jgi:glutamate racemase